MRWWKESKTKMSSHSIIVFILLALNVIQLCNGARRSQRVPSTPDLYIPEPSAESLAAIGQAMGAAGFEDYTEGKALVKRLIPTDGQANLDIVEHLGVIGRAGVDFPALSNIPTTGFICKNVPTGYYADLETGCQVFHICDTSRKISFLCPNGTIFSQSHLICDWWFKVDCASAPALYESSVEYYLNEQKKSQKSRHNLKKSDLQQLSNNSDRTETRRAPVYVPTTTERAVRHKERVQPERSLLNGANGKPTPESYQSLLEVNQTQGSRIIPTFENRKKNLVQLISNNFGNSAVKTTLPVYDSSTRKTTIPVYDHNSLREMQVAAETASFVQNQNRQFLQEYNSKTFRPYPVFTPHLNSKPSKNNNPTLTTLYDIQSKQPTQYLQEATTRQHTLFPYTEIHSSKVNETREPYTRPGVSLLKNFLEKEKNRTYPGPTDTLVAATARIDRSEDSPNTEKSVTVDTKNTFESTTNIPETTKDNSNIKTTPTVQEILTTFKQNEPAAEQSYQERRDRLLRKLNFDNLETIEPSLTTTEKYHKSESNKFTKEVPPSLAPKTLHSLAIYYATALDNLATSLPEDSDTTTASSNNENGITDQSLPALFSQQTITKYGNLFGHGSNNADLLEDIKLDPNGTYNEIAEDLSLQMSQGPLATSPQIRELAQIFTHALSAYLQDPVQFRKVLSDIRPTPPSITELLTTTEESSNTEPTTTVNEEDDELLGFSDDHKIRDSHGSFREGKALNIVTNYPTALQEASTTIRPITDIPSTTFSTTTTKAPSPYRCCGRISASYTTASTTRDIYSTLYPFTNTATLKANTLKSNSLNEISSTTDNSSAFRHGSISGANWFFNKHDSLADAAPFTDILEATTVPTAWGLDLIDSTLSPITKSHQKFESKKIKPTNYVPSTTQVYFTETDSIELENDEELQRAHSQSFISPQSNSLRQGKQLKNEQNKIIRRPSEDLEAPTQSTEDSTTVQPTTQATTTIHDQTETSTTPSLLLSSLFTSPDSDKSTKEIQWQTTFGNWQSTILDPITLNDGLSATGPEQEISEITQQTNAWALDTATTPSTLTATNVPIISTTEHIEITSDKQNERSGKLLRDTSSTEPSLDISTVTDKIVDKAKEIMSGMNASTTQKLMNVMKKTKSKTVRRLILLLVQTCDDDHNSTAEASKKALLEALMAVSQKDMEDVAKEEILSAAPVTIADVDYVKSTVYQRRSDITPVQARSGKNLNIESEATTPLSSPTTTESLKVEETTQYITTSTAKSPSRRGGRKFKSTEAEQFTTAVPDRPIAEARVAPQQDLKVQSDTRAIELLRSLYTIAARWG